MLNDRREESPAHRKTRDSPSRIRARSYLKSIGSVDNRHGANFERTPELLRDVIRTDGILESQREFVLADQSQQIVVLHGFHRVPKARSNREDLHEHVSCTKRCSITSLADLCYADNYRRNRSE